jgi:PAS domain S-box-containing protein
MQKERISKSQNTEFKAIASIFEEDIIILSQDLTVVYLNESAEKNLNVKSYTPYQTKCAEIFKDFCVNCKSCSLKKLQENSKSSFNLPFDNSFEYRIHAKQLPKDVFKEELYFLRGLKVSTEKKLLAHKPTKVWNLSINYEYIIVESDDNAFNYTFFKKDQLITNEIKFTQLIQKDYTIAFQRLHKKVIDSGKPEELLSILSYQNIQQRVKLLLKPNSSSDYSHCEIEVTPFMKDTEDEITQFENLRLQNYLYAITEEFAQADTNEKGYKLMVSMINEVLKTNLCGILHFKSKDQFLIESALLNQKYYTKIEPILKDPEIIPYFTRQLIINDEIKINDINKTKVIYKKELLKTGTKSFYVLTLKHNLRLVGAIMLGFPKQNKWTSNHINFIKTIGSIVLHTILQDEISEKVRRVNENFLNIFESSSDAVFIVQLNGRIIEVNRAAETLTGYTKKELTNKNVSDISKSENLNISQMPFEMLQSHQMIFGTEVINRNNESIAVETREKIIRFQDKLSVLVIARDVRHRREINKMMVQTISETEDKERQRIAEGLHDDVGPLLSTLRIYIDLLKNEELNEKEIEEYAVKMNEIIHQAIETVREVSRNLMPGVLKDFGLVEALEDFCSKINKTGVLRINFDYDAKHYNLENSIRSVIYTVIKELINNSIKHADASEVILSIKKDEESLYILVQDNGIGFDMKKLINQNTSGLGIKNLLSKINAISGEIEVLNTKGFGIKIKIPIQ